MTWLREVQEIFRERTEMPVEAIYESFGISQDVSIRDFQAALRIFKDAYGVPVGLLRSDDSLETFVRDPKSKHPISWVWRRFQYEDRLSELNDHMAKGRIRAGAPALRESPATIRDFVLAWAGKDSAA
jgi:hypothetical protein